MISPEGGIRCKPSAARSSGPSEGGDSTTRVTACGGKFAGGWTGTARTRRKRPDKWPARSSRTDLSVAARLRALLVDPEHQLAIDAVDGEDPRAHVAVDHFLLAIGADSKHRR